VELTARTPGNGIRALSLLVATGALAHAQTTHVVSGGGPALQNAIATAVAGDTLDVQPAINAGVTCTKGLRIRMQPGAQIGASPGGVAVTFQAIPATDVAVLTGGVVNGVACHSCDGPSCSTARACAACCRQPRCRRS
jgi:hypothetical protein